MNIFVCVKQFTDTETKVNPTSDKNFIESVEDNITKFLPDMERVKIIEASLKKNGRMIKTKNIIFYFIHI